MSTVLRFRHPLHRREKQDLVTSFSFDYLLGEVVEITAGSRRGLRPAICHTAHASCFSNLQFVQDDVRLTEVLEGGVRCRVEDCEGWMLARRLLAVAFRVALMLLSKKATRQTTKEMCCFVGKPRPCPLKPLTSKLNAAVQCYTSCLFQK